MDGHDRQPDPFESPWIRFWAAVDLREMLGVHAGCNRVNCRSGIRPEGQHHRLSRLRAAGRNPVVAADLDQTGIATTIQEPACFNLLLAYPIQPPDCDRSLAGVRPDLPV